MKTRRLLVIQVAALGFELFERELAGRELAGLQFHAARSVFPAMTCPVQGTMRTALPPARHGMIANGHYVHKLRKPLFWEQSSALVEGPRIWSDFRANGGRVGMFFWQQSLGEDVDMLLSPAPIHTHGGGMIDTVYSHPAELYDTLCRSLGTRFKLSSYWGPLARAASTRWIARATCELLRRDDAPDLAFTYLPHLDYDLQRHGPDSPKASNAMSLMAGILRELIESARALDYEILVFGDYAIERAKNVVFPNHRLREAGLFKVRSIRGRLYPDFHASDALAMVDHQVAMVYVRDTSLVDRVGVVLDEDPGIELLMPEQIGGEFFSHGRSPDLVIQGRPGHWLAYRWWDTKREAPDYATHVDIHNKPGYDPCELFFGSHPFVVSTDEARVGGTHGRLGDESAVAWATSLPIDEPVSNLVEIAQRIEAFLSPPVS